MVVLNQISEDIARTEWNKQPLPSTIRNWLSRNISSLPVNVELNLWNREYLRSSGTAIGGINKALAIEIRHPGVIRDVILRRDPYVVIEAYIHGLLDFEGDLQEMNLVTSHLPAFSVRLDQAIMMWLEAIKLPKMPVQQTINSAGSVFEYRSPQWHQLAIQAHYDLGNDFYQLWLDPHMVYSCAHFEDEDASLVKAQEAKLDLICRKLRLQPGEMLLDIGCGWGALLRWAVENYGVDAYGITLSEQQTQYNRQWIAEAGLQDRVKVEVCDYRHLPENVLFDKIVSVGMIEHVGLQNYPKYFQSIYAALKPGGLFLNHGITTLTKYESSGLAERFINRYIFPDGELANLAEMIQPILAAGWEIVDVDCWRTHYAKTLQCWAENFERIKDKAEEMIGPEKTRAWKLYLNGSALGFANNHLSIYQMLLRRVADAQWDLPLTRSGWLV